MAWICLVELAASASHSQNGLDQSLTVKTTDSLNLFCYPEWLRMSYRELHYGTTSELLRDMYSHEQKLFMEVFHAKTLVLRELARAWQESEADCFMKSSDYVGNYDPDSCSWKTSQLSLFEALSPFAQNSLRFGMIVGGRLYLPLRWEPHTSDNDGSYLPTPTATEYGTNQSMSEGSKIRMSLPMMARKNLWPTPCASDNRDRGNMSDPAVQRRIRIGKQVGLSTAVKETKECGTLNPLWVEWLMGFPIEWTDLNALGMQWFQCKQKKPL